MNTNNDKFRASSTKSNIICTISIISCANEVYLVYIYKSIINICFIIIKPNNDKFKSS